VDEDEISGICSHDNSIREILVFSTSPRGEGRFSLI
jgi:hypothetical protein